MKQRLPLDDVTLFLAIADAGGLAGAVRLTGVSAPTLSRRMTALEQYVGQRLFERGPRGYTLTSEGRSLLEEATPVREAAAVLDRWKSRAEARPRVRITAGLWTSRFLATHIHEFWSERSRWIPEFLASNMTVDIARREADIGIRNHRPEQAWLAGRRTRTITYAVYARAPEVQGYVALNERVAPTPSGRWLRASFPDNIMTTASDARLLLDLALAGVGRIVMPCMAGDAVAGLVRLSDQIDELTHDEWLVCHHEARHDSPVRAALDAITALLTVS
ncbi:LysR family transcriptional regulator [Halovulum sp. GXIMD14793]